MSRSKGWGEVLLQAAPTTLEANRAAIIKAGMGHVLGKVAAPRRLEVKRAKPELRSLEPLELPCRLVLEGPPRTKNTGKSPRPGVVIPSATYRRWFAASMSQVRALRDRGLLVGTASEPVTVTALWFRDRNAGDEDRFKVGLGDFLQRAGLVLNDDLIHWSGDCRREIDRERPRTEVLIERDTRAVRS